MTDFQELTPGFIINKANLPSTKLSYRKIDSHVFYVVELHKWSLVEREEGGEH